MDTLNSFTPIKKKYACGNKMPFMTKNFSKEIMTRLRLRNKYLKDNTEENRLLYIQQRNKRVSVFKENCLENSKKLKNSRVRNHNHNFENVKDPDFKTILKYKNHPSIIVIKEK